MDFGKRSTDQGREDPWNILARIDERQKAMDEAIKADRISLAATLERHFHEDNGNFAAVRQLAQVENEKLHKKIDYLTVRMAYAAGGLVVIVFLIEIIGGIKH